MEKLGRQRRVIRLTSFETRPKAPYTHAVRAHRIPRRFMLDGKFAAVAMARETDRGVWLIQAIRPSSLDGFGAFASPPPPRRPAVDERIDLDDGSVLRARGCSCCPKYVRYEIIVDGSVRVVSHDWLDLCWSRGWRVDLEDPDPTRSAGRAVGAPVERPDAARQPERAAASRRHDPHTKEKRDDRPRSSDPDGQLGLF